VRVIRRATSADAAAIAPLLDELGYPSTAAQVEARLAALPADELVLVAEVDGQVAALAGLRVERLLERDEPSGRLTALVVGSRWRGRGLGESLVRAVEEEARAHGCERVVLTSGNHRSEAHTFYGRLGYEPTGRRFAKQL
jgi:predicted N-acetyltransferase YhbS